MSIFSNEKEIAKIREVLVKYIMLPFSGETIPGNIMEGVLSYVRGGIVLNKYDFVDVYDPNKRIGWQVKVTKASTPLTWKRAKISNKEKLIRESRSSPQGLAELGNSIIRFCNLHAQESMEKYNLNEIGLSRLVICEDGKVFYYERMLCSRKSPNVFDENDFEWYWSNQKKTTKKEQLSALHGVHKKSGKKWWAWHGLGENQLHFSGESNWWPRAGDPHRTDFCMPSPSERISLDAFLRMVDTVSICSPQRSLEMEEA